MVDKRNNRIYNTVSVSVPEPVLIRNPINEQLITVDAPASYDAFRRLRVSEPHTLFDSKLLHGKQPNLWSETTSGNATSIHSEAYAEVVMTVAGNNDLVIRQTRQCFNYQPGKSMLYFMTTRMPASTDVIKRVGPFDHYNGIFFQVSGTVASWNIRKNGAISESVSQTEWDDPMDGTGTSGITLDLNAPQILILDFEWLGIGSVRVGFLIDSALVYVHSFFHSNHSEITTVYMTTPNLPLRYEISSIGGSGSLQQICSTVISEGGGQETGIIHAIDTGFGSISMSLANKEYPVIAIRLQQGKLDHVVDTFNFSLMTTTANANIKWSLLMNPVINGTLNWIQIANSGVEYALPSGLATITDQNFKIDSGHFSSQMRQETHSLVSPIRIGSGVLREADRDVLVLAAGALTATNTIFGSLTLREHI